MFGKPTAPGTAKDAVRVEGYNSMGQMAFWTCRETAASAAHTHDYDYDEYMIVAQVLLYPAH